jgi:hypothetical protein
VAELDTLAVSHPQSTGGGVSQSDVSVHGFSDELCVTVAALQMMQSPGSIFGFAGRKTRLIPFPIKTVGVRGTARFKHAAGVPARVQLPVMQAVCADAGENPAQAATARARARPEAPGRAGDMTTILRRLSDIEEH